MGRKQGGGIVGLLGKGVGMAAEYHQHRAEQKALRQPSQEPSREPSREPSPLPSPRGSDSLSPYGTQDSRGGDRPRSLAPTSSSHTEDSKLSSEKSHSYSSKSDYSSMKDNDEVAWELDDSSESDAPPSYDLSEKRDKNNDELAGEVVSFDLKRSTGPINLETLPYPVILPQRRPGKNSRGFVRAYAPLLGECKGIDQETFLTFLKNFHKSSQASPIFGIIQLSAGIAGFAPGMIAMAVTTAVGIGAQVGEKMHENMRTNNYLDKINKELFIPKGLFAMIVTYNNNPNSSSGLSRFGIGTSTSSFNAHETIASKTGAASSNWKNMRGVTSGTTGEMELPEAAPLIFPKVVEQLDHEGPETFKDKKRDLGKFIDGYMDRKAQQKYAQDNPDSALVIPEDQRQFASKYSDPNHPMFNGGLIGLATGGMLSRGGGGRNDRDKRRSRDNRDMRRGRGVDYYDPRQGGDYYDSRQRCGYYDPRQGPDYNDPRRRGDYYDPDKKDAYYGGRQNEDFYDGRWDDDERSYQSAGRYNDGRNYQSMDRYNDRRGNNRGRKERGGIKGAVKGTMKEGVLYLMIVNMPSEEELEHARRQMGVAAQSESAQPGSTQPGPRPGTNIGPY